MFAVAPLSWQRVRASAAVGGPGPPLLPSAPACRASCPARLRRGLALAACGSPPSTRLCARPLASRAGRLPRVPCPRGRARAAPGSPPGPRAAAPLPPATLAGARPDAGPRGRPPRALPRGQSPAAAAVPGALAPSPRSVLRPGPRAGPLTLPVRVWGWSLSRGGPLRGLTRCPARNAARSHPWSLFRGPPSPSLPTQSCPVLSHRAAPAPCPRRLRRRPPLAVALSPSPRASLRVSPALPGRRPRCQ